MNLVVLPVHELRIDHLGERTSRRTCVALVVSAKDSDSISHYSYATLGNVKIVPMGEQAMSIIYQLLASRASLGAFPKAIASCQWKG